MLDEALRCPDCAGKIVAEGEGARCSVCSARFAHSDGILDMLGDASQINRSELETQDRVSDHYEHQRYRHPHSRAYHEHTLEVLTSLVPPRGAVLDDGCGNGLLFDHFAKSRLAVERLYGVDLSMKMLAFAKKRFAAIGAPGALVRGDACRLPFAPSSFDVVYARSLLHHLPNPQAGTAEAARVLKPGGLLVALDPNRTFISDLPRAVARRGEHFDDDHKNFKLSELVGLLDPQLFDLERTEFMGYVAYPLLGFPDLLDFSRFLPLAALTSWLLKLDDAIAKVPALRKLGWGVVLVARRR